MVMNGDFWQSFLMISDIYTVGIFGFIMYFLWHYSLSLSQT